MEIYNWADQMELSKREVTLTRERSHPDLIFILIEKKFYVKHPRNVVAKRDSQ